MTGIELIAAERQRQIDVEGWTPEHDDEHFMGEMIGASITYAAHALGVVSDEEIPCADSGSFWPWDDAWFKPSPDPIRNLVKAGALIAAEIDRLKRKSAPPMTPTENIIDPTLEYRCRCSGCGAVWNTIGEPGKCPSECLGDTIHFEPSSNFMARSNGDNCEPETLP